MGLAPIYLSSSLSAAAAALRSPRIPSVHLTSLPGLVLLAAIELS